MGRLRQTFGVGGGFLTAERFGEGFEDLEHKSVVSGFVSPGLLDAHRAQVGAAAFELLLAENAGSFVGNGDLYACHLYTSDAAHQLTPSYTGLLISVRSTNLSHKHQKYVT